MCPKLTPNAPRFHTLLQKYVGKPIFIVNRSDWEMLKVDDGTFKLIEVNDLSFFPFAPISSMEEYLGTVARKSGDSVKISVYRLDPKDEPTPINVDTYTVWERLPQQYDVDQMILYASTSNDPNFEKYLSEHIFLVKDNETEGHWLEKLPDEIAILIESID